MSLIPIPNQPLNFLPGMVIADCPDKCVPLLFKEGDALIFQILQTVCPGTEGLVTNPDFLSGWTQSGGWVISQGDTCGGNQFGGTLQNVGFVPVVGTTYTVQIEVTSISGAGVLVSIGGYEWPIADVGTHTFTFTASDVSGFRIILVNEGSAACLSSAQVFPGNTSITVDVVQGETTVESFNPEDNPEYFQYIGEHVVFIAPVPDGLDEGEFHVEISDDCTEAMCSQPMMLDECKQTILMRVCNDYEAMGFKPVRFDVRLASSLTRPRYEYEVAEQRLSNGFIDRHYIDRQRVMSLSIERQDDRLHPFISAMPMFDHFYIGADEYSIDADGYEPEYGEETSVGAVLFNVRPKQELLRKVLCDEVGEGCDPDNDPICNSPQVTIVPVLNANDMRYTIEVVLFGLTGFATDRLLWSVNGTPTGNVDFSSPQSQVLGPFSPCTVIDITITNAVDPACNYSERVVIPDCSGAVVFYTDGAVGNPGTPGSNSFSILTSTTFFAPELAAFWESTQPDCAYFATQGGTSSDPVQIYPHQDGRWCYSPALAPALIQPNTDFTAIEFVGGIFTFIDLTGTAGMALARLKVTNVPNLAFFARAPFTAAMQYLDLSGLTLATFEVNDILVEMDALGTSGGTIILDGTNNAAPSGAGLTAKAALISRGWTVDTN